MSESSYQGIQMGLVYLLIGILIFLAYVILIMAVREPEDLGPETEREDLALEEYRTINEEVRRRGEMLAVHGSIFVIASLTLLGAAASGSVSRPARVVIVFLALLVYGTWLFSMTYSTRRLDDIAFARLRRIEERLGFRAHRYMRDSTRGAIWLEARRFIWGFVLILLVFGGYLLLLKT